MGSAFNRRCRRSPSNGVRSVIHSLSSSKMVRLVGRPTVGGDSKRVLLGGNRIAMTSKGRPVVEVGVGKLGSRRRLLRALRRRTLRLRRHRCPS